MKRKIVAVTAVVAIMVSIRSIGLFVADYTERNGTFSKESPTEKVVRLDAFRVSLARPQTNLIVMIDGR